MESPEPAFTTPLIPRQLLFGNPVRSSPKISPDAKKLAFLAPVDDVLNVWAGDVGADLSTFVPITSDTDRGVRVYFWAQDSRQILYLQDAGGNENWRLFAVDLETKITRDLTPFENVQVRVVDTHKDFPDQVLIAMNRDDVRLHDVYRLHLSTGELTKIAANPGNVVGWLTDADFRLRAASAMTPDGSSQLLVRDSDAEDSPWKLIQTWAPEDALNSRPVSFTKDGQSMFIVNSAGANAGRLTIRTLVNGASEVIAEDPQYDAGFVMLHPDTHALQALTFNRDKTEWTFFDPHVAADFDTLTKVQAGDVSLVSRDRDDKAWVVLFHSDTRTTAYYHYDRESKTARYLFSAKPEIDNYTLSHMEPVEFQSRDGLTIHAYLSLPAGIEPKSLPLVLNVHGGPWARDSWGLNTEAQWFTNRGYASLQVNYRGSTGYGKDFLNAGNREWAGKMHDDLVDAVHWAVDQGIADPAKVAIYGGSYGGYSALVGATFTPDLFCCAVDIVGPSSLITLIKSIPPYWETMIAVFHERVGNPDTDEEFLKSRSPLFRVDAIKIPLLIAQGANDPRVKKAEADQIVAALVEKGIDHEYLVFEDEGHGFAKPENRLKFYAAAERFLAKHLGGRYE